MKSKKVLAIVAVVFLISMYLATLALAIFKFPGSDQLFKGFVLLDIAVPLILWVLIYVYKRFGDHK